MEKTKLLTIAVIGLLIINLGTLSLLWFRTPAPGRGVQDKALRFIMDELSYDDQQRLKCNQILREHRQNMDKIHGSIRQQHNAVFDNLAQGDTSKLAAIGDLYHQNELEIFNYFTSLRNVANDQQKVKFDQIIQEAMRIMPPPKQ